MGKYNRKKTGHELIAKLKGNPEFLYLLTENEFERVIDELLNSQGFETIQHSRSRLSRSLIAYKDDRENYLVQCLMRDKDNKVGIKEVRGFIDDISLTKATMGILVTTSSFTAHARKLLSEHKPTLQGVDFSDLRHWLSNYGRRSSMDVQDVQKIGTKAKRETEAFINHYVNDRARGWPVFMERAKETTFALPLYFDLSEFIKEEIEEILSKLSSLYADCGGDRLIIDDMTVLDVSDIPEPVEG